MAVENSNSVFGRASSQEFPRAILHVDGDAFFVACEVACNPALLGKPVVTGADRRIASALSYEAKALGVSRAMPIHEIRKLFPEVIVIPSHYR
jgi:nucleotidyltransferase/DNA polymerase involved in DNA repair